MTPFDDAGFTTTTTPAITDPFSLTSLVSWLELQPPAQTYCYTDIGHCLLSQYMLGMGFKGVNCGAFANVRWEEPDGKIVFKDLGEQFWQVAVNHPRDFGSALIRARSYQS
jgi:hypothetical protein